MNTAAIYNDISQRAEENDREGYKCREDPKARDVIHV